MTLSSNRWGMTVSNGGAVSLSASTVSNNPEGGIWVSSPTSLSLDNVTISDNPGFAMSMDAGVTFGTISSLTVMGNGTNGVAVRPSTASEDTTWKNIGIPYVPTGELLVQRVTPPVPVLTIEPGVTVRFNGGAGLRVGFAGPGNLQAVGTPADPITFTANTATPTPGFWYGLRLGPQTTAGSRIANATVRYGGGADTGGIDIQGCSPAIESVTLQNNSFDGIRVRGGSPMMTDLTLSSNRWGLVVFDGGSPSLSASTVSNNPQGGIWVSSPTTLSLDAVTISNNPGFAMTTDAGVTLGTVSGLTVMNNGTDGIEVRGSTAGADATWRNIGIPYIVTGEVLVQRVMPPVPVLTIEPGVTVRFNSNLRLLVGFNYPGGLQAIGTAPAPITFTANTAAPTPGFWTGIHLASNATPSSRIAYASVRYGGQAGLRGGIHVAGSSPTLDHVRLELNSYAGLSANSSAAVVKSCGFENNAAGIVNQTPASELAAALNWWGSWDGPSGEAYGSGQSVSRGVSFEPWLLDSASHPHFFSSFSHDNRVFYPSLGIYTTLDFATSQSGDWAVTFYDLLFVPVRTFTGSGSTGNPTWDGLNSLGMEAPEGWYFYFAESQAAGDIATPLLGLTYLVRS